MVSPVITPAAGPRPPRPAGRLKVCLASLAPFVGGAEVAAERLALGLLEEGHDVFLLLGQQNEVMDRLQRAGLRCVYAPMHLTDKWRFWRFWLSQRGLRGVLTRERPDVLHSNDLPTHQVLSAAARGLGVPRVCHHRFVFPRAAIDWMCKYGAERHLFVSRGLMDELCGESPALRAHPARAVVHDGLPLPPAATPEARAAARDKLGLPGDRVIVTIAGQVIERKGVADLIRAWALLAPELRAGAELVVVGDDLAGNGAYRAEMERLAGEVGTPARFVGFRKDVPDWLLASDVAAVPSHVEPLGNATLEAMAHSLPVIGGNVGGIPEMVADGVTGALVPPRDPPRLAAAVAALIADRGLRQRQGAAGRRRCEELFSLHAHTRAVLGEYRHVLPRSAAS